jgi:hypothetical protein
MAGDGVSLPTNIAQMGSVAKTQAKGQQTHNQAQPFADQVHKKDELKAQRVKETNKAEQQKINPDEERERDKRRRRRQRRKAKFASDQATEELEQLQEEGAETPDAEQVGRLLDLRV